MATRGCDGRLGRAVPAPCARSCRGGMGVAPFPLVRLLELRPRWDGRPRGIFGGSRVVETRRRRGDAMVVLAAPSPCRAPALAAVGWGLLHSLWFVCRCVVHGGTGARAEHFALRASSRRGGDAGMRCSVPAAPSPRRAPPPAAGGGGGLLHSLWVV